MFSKVGNQRGSGPLCYILSSMKHGQLVCEIQCAWMQSWAQDHWTPEVFHEIYTLILESIPVLSPVVMDRAFWGVNTNSCLKVMMVHKRPSACRPTLIECCRWRHVGMCVCRSLTDVAGVRPRCQPDARWDVWGFGPNQMALGMMGVFFSLSVCVVTLTYLLSSGIFLERKCKNLISFQCITNSLFLFVLFSPASSAHSSLGKVGDLFKLLALKKSTNTLTH